MLDIYSSKLFITYEINYLINKEKVLKQLGLLFVIKKYIVVQDEDFNLLVLLEVGKENRIRIRNSNYFNLKIENFELIGTYRKIRNFKTTVSFIREQGQALTNYEFN